MAASFCGVGIVPPPFVAMKKALALVGARAYRTEAHAPGLVAVPCLGRRFFRRTLKRPAYVGAPAVNGAVSLFVSLRL